eukprot:CAMPEP_0197178884 /NCGR_PEP_ID=MMETSP1423-20130617/4018_1 /TAXON_ID=476441 /ORGANISM="Pseudo-nitzschia heimii, Strain UNC1101" /LENGTH=244 /DNA_ID=CAMNT_0042628703 /DNA_START=17 /DNA_END=751 /DNA_ORIENTATION=+
MTLRLSSSSTNPTTSIDGYMKRITEDTSVSLTQKSDCLKTLGIVLKNLIDASKGASIDGAKYRTLKTDNPKLRSRLFCCDGVRSLLLDADLVGMVATESALTTATDVPSPELRDAIGLRVLPAVSTAQREIAARLERDGSNGTSTKKAKLSEHDSNGRRSALVPSSSAAPVVEKLSEKQKARRLLEEKRRLEKEREKAFRNETRAKIAADKLVRQKDENWKPSVSAAADKTGTGLLTFRDRHGE